MLPVFILVAFAALTSGLPNYPNNPQLDGRIVGGETVDIKDYPYQVSLQTKYGHHCGGSIIGKKHILTAGHCVAGWTRPSDFTVRAGSSTVDEGGVQIQVAKIVHHKSYNSHNSDYDVALLLLVEELPFNERIQPISICASEPTPGTESVVSGWGSLLPGEGGPKELQAVRVPVVAFEECSEAYGDGTITPRMICAGYPEGGRDACHGDSGGPLVANGELVGVVSWGFGCAMPGYPGVYGNVATFHSWIKTHL